MAESPDEPLDLIWPPPQNGDAETAAAPPRPWVGVHFECCDVYSRIYRDPRDRQYQGKCPKCQRWVRLRVGPDGVMSRVFRARPM